MTAGKSRVKKRSGQPVNPLQIKVPDADQRIFLAPSQNNL
jgi:hypothetical protein